MNDLKPFKHGEEGTHYVCQEVLELKGGKATCCGCSGHKCKKPKPMKRIKKEVEKKAWSVVTTWTPCSECMCHAIGSPIFAISGGREHCANCSPKPSKPINDRCEFCNTEPFHEHKKGCSELQPIPKPTKIEKKLVIKEEWCETTFEQQKDRLYVHMRYFEDDDSGGKWEGGSSSFSVPLKKLKDYLLSH